MKILYGINNTQCFQMNLPSPLSFLDLPIVLFFPVSYVAVSSAGHG